MKKFMFKGKTIEELNKMEFKDFIKLVPSRKRRSLSRGLVDQHKILLEKIKKDQKKQIKTNCRDMIVLPEMVGSNLLVFTGKEWTHVNIMEDMLGHRLGEFTLTRKKVAHSAPGVGATRSSAAISQK